MSGSSTPQNENTTAGTSAPAPTDTGYDGRGLNPADVPEGMTITSQVDVDGDGTVDVAHLTDANGANVNVYLDGNGDVILAETDQNADGVIDTLTYVGEDGLILQEHDVDQDGRADYRTALDDAGNTVRLDVFNEAGDGVFMSVHDTDGDGIPDLATADLDGDGIQESAVLDTDGDGIADTVLTDTDGDGEVDTVSTVYGGPDNVYDDPTLPEDSNVPYDVSDPTAGADTVVHDDPGAGHSDADLGI